MCLGIPGQVVELVDANDQLARVDVSGVTRVVNIGLLEDEHLATGDWVLIHVGFAMSKIDEEEASVALASLKLMGQAYGDELDAFWSSRITSEDQGGTRWESSPPFSPTRPSAPEGESTLGLSSKREAG
jgi:hydrogenase expression/formation protein HypC